MLSIDIKSPLTVLRHVWCWVEFHPHHCLRGVTGTTLPLVLGVRQRFSRCRTDPCHASRTAEYPHSFQPSQDKLHTPIDFYWHCLDLYRENCRLGAKTCHFTAKMLPRRLATIIKIYIATRSKGGLSILQHLNNYMSRSKMRDMKRQLVMILSLHLHQLRCKHRGLGRERQLSIWRCDADYHG